MISVQIDYTGVEMSSPCFTCAQNFSWNSTKPCTCSVPFHLDQPYEVRPAAFWVKVRCSRGITVSLPPAEQRLHVLRTLQLLPEPPAVRQVPRRQPAERKRGVPQGEAALLRAPDVLLHPAVTFISLLPNRNPVRSASRTPSTATSPSRRAAPSPTACLTVTTQGFPSEPLHIFC